MENINIIDFAIIFLYFAILITVGYLVMKRAKSGEDFLVASRKLPLPIFFWFIRLKRTLPHEWRGF